MKILKIIGIIILLVIVAALIMTLSTPGEGSLESSITIDAPPAVVYEECINIKKLDAWSPWYNIEPPAFSYEGPEEGVGAKSVWHSENPELGDGSLTIIEAIPNEMIKTKMVFGDFAGNFNSWIKLEPNDEGTEVTWGYDYKDIGFVGKFFMSMMDINKEMLPKLENGLKDLKQIVEAKPAPEHKMDEATMEADSTEIESTNM